MTTSSNMQRPGQDSDVVYVMPAEGSVNDELSLIDLWNILWKGRRLIIASTAVTVLISLVYGFTATEWYRSDVLLIPNSENSADVLSGNLGGLGGIASLAGFSVGGSDAVESLAVLNSRELAREFLDHRNLLPVLFSDDWVEETGEWKEQDPLEQPDLRDAAKYFGDEVHSVSQDSRSKLVTLSIRWTDPDATADWAMDLVGRVNETMRNRAIQSAEQNIAYLQNELETTNVTVLRDSIGSLLESELKKLMIARGNDEYAFRVVDSAQVPKLRVWPNRSLLAILAVLVGGIVGSLVVLIRHASHNYRESAIPASSES